MKKRSLIKGIGWGGLYLFLTVAPLFVMLVSPAPGQREFWRELSVSFGFVGLSMMALQFVLTARFQWLKSPYGSDVVYLFHRQISIVAFLLIISHPILLFVFSPSTVSLLNIFTAPWRARAAVVSVLALLGLIGFSIWRKTLKLDYYTWRIWHGIFAILAVGMALIHIELVGYYLNTPWKKILWLVYAVFWIGLLLYTRLLKPLWIMRRPYIVVDVQEERGNAWTITLKPDGHQGLRFHPGQFAWINVRSSPFSEKEHPFSFSSSSENTETISFTIKALGDFTKTIKDISVGERVYVDGPYGSFSIDNHDHAKAFMFIAGGVGITPMMSMLRALSDRQDSRPLTLIYANRDWESITFREELESLKRTLNLNVVHVLEQPPHGWNGKTGYINRDLLEGLLPSGIQKNDLEIFICGPIPMMNAVDGILGSMKFWPGDYHSERFDLV